ncbi:N-acetylmuramic acid 6-phosphate etherase [Thermohalobacter berrensis]|uniref:N-acetylmuramic acid 6-phosphate etherase n=2 Tax=Thermohalobacter berrensis TaxID=99594 RepID=A0A419T4A9_9FIRM|nr:N-acetylmuramic acid 6-phosphate etherase [Thermohalobacter berrensis]RKD32253.1 N-acetylmuramic acid 6-phosphate etherase [Thermohalobacter berrensis]
MDAKKLAKLTTESRNPNTLNIDTMSTHEIVTAINEEDKKVAYAVEKAKEKIAEAIDLITERLSKGGRLFYVGAGTSGRLGIVDASECPPTFGVSHELVQGVIAGGNEAIFKATEGAEDNKELGKEDLKNRGLNNKDVVCGIAASGRTPYVIGALEYAKELGALTVSITMNSESKISKMVDVPISIEVGPEVITGSTRMKAGTAQKMILNMLSTGTMIKLGKVYSNLMVDVKVSNEKLFNRAKRIIMITTGVDEDKAEEMLKRSNNNVKLAIMMIKTGLEKEEAERLLNKNSGHIRRALGDYENEVNK